MFPVILLWVISLALADYAGPESIDSLLSFAFKDADRPKFTPVPLAPNVAISANDTALLKVNSLTIEPYPLRPGIMNFTLLHSLTSSIDPGAKLHVTAWSGFKKSYSGTIDLCEYLPFAKLPCPVPAYPTKSMLQRLQVPEEADAVKVSFVARAENPDGGLIAYIAAIIDLVNPGRHDEL